MALLFTNNATGTLANTLTSGATSAVLNSGEGQNFPSPSGGDTFYATLEDVSGNIEVVSCTARSTDTLTIVRAQDSTTALEFPAGSRLELRVTAAVLEAMSQTADAGDLYAPKTHFNDNGTAAEQLNNGSRATLTTVQGQAVQRTSGQTTTTVSLRDSSGTEEGTVYTNTSKNMALTNKQLGGDLEGWATNASGTAVRVLNGDPDAGFSGYNQGNVKHVAETYGFSIRGTNNLAPYDAHWRIYAQNGTTLLGAIGYISSTNEFRIVSYANGFPIGLFGNNNGGTLASVITGDPDGASQMFYANAKKIETTSTGGAVTGVMSQTGTPSAASHLTTKSYVDTQITSVASPASSLAVNGYYTHPGGLTDQWGQVSVNGDTFAVVTFPTTYGAVYSVVATVDSSSVGANENITQVSSVTTSSFRVYNGNSATRTFYWQAKGSV